MTHSTHKQERSTKQISTLFLRAAVVIMGLGALGLSCLIVPMVYNGWEYEYPTMVMFKYPVLVILIATMVPFFAALYQAFTLLGYIDTQQAFSLLSVKALRKITISAVVFSGLYVVLLPITYLIAKIEDAPGLVLIGGVMVGAPIVIAVFASVLEKLLKSALLLKDENDLTV